MPPPNRQLNRIHAAMTKWHEALPSTIREKHSQEDILSSTPKKWTVYEPMALLPAGSFTSPAWTALLHAIEEETVSGLWQLVLKELSSVGPKVTHLAITEGIPLHKEGDEAENVLRSPTGLRMLYGDFGPSVADETKLDDEAFEEAFWVSTKQNGIFQTWAPRWTMFSRGNIKEKARLLDFPKAEEGEWAVDLYAGIGYFVFSYASLGFRVVCWEINPWSVEGLRRGAKANRWSVRVVQGDDLDLSTDEILVGGEQIIVFLESNDQALKRTKAVQETRGLVKDIKHVNCGFLPTSEPMWKPAWEMTSHGNEAWLHFHDNVGVEGIEERKAKIETLTATWAASEDSSRISEVSHVEQVKTFAPGVWHCVFDTHTTRSNTH